MSKKFKRIFFIFIILILIFYVYYTFPRRFEENYDGIEYRLGNDEYQRKVSIKIDGWYTRKVFDSDYFQGAITIDDTKLSKWKLFTQEDGGQQSVLNEKTSEFESIGTFYVGKRLEEFTICVHEEGDKPSISHWNPNDSLMISAPSENRREAISLSNRLMKNILGKGQVLK